LLLDRRSIENYLDLEVARRVLKRPDPPDFGPFEVPGAS
jgi:hypothetical protein